MRAKIELNTLSDVNDFIAIATKIDCGVYLEDNTGNHVSAKSILGALYSLEWNEIYCTCERDIYNLISKWVI